MRIHYYKFPDDTPENVLLENGCEVILKNGNSILVDSIPDDKRHLVEGINHTIYGTKVSFVKKLMKQYGGCGWTCHCERDGGVFEVTDITLKGNNSKFKYNRHL